MKVYLLNHVRSDNDDEDVKTCGIYGSEQEAAAAIDRAIERRSHGLIIA